MDLYFYSMVSETDRQGFRTEDLAPVKYPSLEIFGVPNAGVSQEILLVFNAWKRLIPLQVVVLRA